LNLLEPRTNWIVGAAVVLLVALLVRGYGLEQPLFYSDEAFSWRVCTYTFGEMILRVAGDTHPPGHFVVQKAWMQCLGDSPHSLRGLSILFGLATVGLAMMLLYRWREGQTNWGVAWWLVAPAAIALHAGQISVSQTARMYSMGCFLGLLSSWLLVRALASARYQAFVLYGVAAAALMLTHNYGVFTAAAQFLWLGGIVIAKHFRWPRQRARRLAGHSLLAVAVCVIVYAPWLGALANQTRRVWRGFWVPPVSRAMLLDEFLVWATGLRAGQSSYAECAIALCLVTMVIGWSVYRRHALCLLFVVQAILPWIATLLMSTIGGRPLLQERYLIFSSAAMLVAMGVFLVHARGLLGKLLVSINLLAMTAVGAIEHLDTMPREHAIANQIVASVRQAYRRGDAMVVSDIRSLNVLKYYAAQQAWDFPRLYCFVPDNATGGHVNHLSSIRGEDIVWSDANPPDDVQRIWIVNYPAVYVTQNLKAWRTDYKADYPPMRRSFESGVRVERLKRRRR
jgi:hypothetical protein